MGRRQHQLALGIPFVVTCLAEMLNVWLSLMRSQTGRSRYRWQESVQPRSKKSGPSTSPRHREEHADTRGSAMCTQLGYALTTSYCTSLTQLTPLPPPRLR